ncbi:hypothetical protein Agub_g14991 [Astrephomene gubernaculifera]|uniref:Uncharacterized protein n=1 Tax=Astrephomene gubernaculifera TaxID=47775 RepID=A0AAD3E4T7_9CHLO|nr:hypothetical protein Agub_g14991 [Astrephomene gubernaculifera]
MAEPVLPWANSPVETAETQADGQEPAEQQVSATGTALTLEAAGLAVGGRLEVKWQIEPDEGEPYSKWWGATVVGPSAQQDPSYPGAPVYELSYDAHDDFEQERCHVVFTSEHTLKQLDQTEELSWRREGDEWEADEDEGEGAEAEGEEAANSEAVLTVEDLIRDEKEILDGKTLEEAEGEVLGSLEPSKRIAVAAGFRDFADNLISFLREKVAASEGGEVTVTPEHVQAFMESMNKKPRIR